MKRFLYNAMFAGCLLFSLTSFSPIHYINPTGTYQFVTKKSQMGYGLDGQICVKILSSKRIVTTLYFYVGQSGHSGSLVDTLAYINNASVYKAPKWDKSCKLTFKFNQKGVTVSQEQDNLNSGCGFGQGVFADGYYKRTSSKMPILKEPGTDELLK